MPVGQDQKDQMDPQEQQQQGDDQAADSAQADADADAGADAAQEEDAEKEEVHPSLTVTSPGSGAQYPAESEVPIEFECEGDVEFTAHVSVLDAGGTQIFEDAADLKLEEGKGHGAFTLGGDAFVAGKYDVLVWGESNGQATPVQKLQVEIAEAEKEEEAEPAVAVDGDDGADEGATV